MYYIVDTSNDPLNYRVGPGKHYKKIGELPSGAIIDGECNNGWVRTNLQGETCYLSMEYLRPLDTPTSYALCYTGDDIVEVIHWLEGLL